MLSRNVAARGRTVYGNGATGPNTGRVSAQGIQGYVNRETRNNANGNYGISRTGRDGQSDTRSGLAAQALNRAGQHRPAGQQSGSRSQWQGAPHWQPGNQSHSNNSGSSAAAGPAAAPTQASTPPEVTVTDTGTLQLPYDDQWGADVIGAMGDYNSQLLDLQHQQQQQALEYMNANRNLGLEYEETKRSTLNGAAAGGTAFSSAYGTAVGRNALNDQNAHNELDTQNSLFNQGITEQRLNIQTMFNDMLRQDALARAANASQDAGSLGYGQSGTGAGSGRGSGNGNGKNGGKGKKGGKAGGNSGSGQGNNNAQWVPAAIRTPYNNTGRTDLARQSMNRGKKK